MGTQPKAPSRDEPTRNLFISVWGADRDALDYVQDAVETALHRAAIKHGAKVQMAVDESNPSAGPGPGGG